MPKPTESFYAPALEPATAPRDATIDGLCVCLTLCLASIEIYGGGLVIDDTIFRNNEAMYGGALALHDEVRFLFDFSSPARRSFSDLRAALQGAFFESRGGVLFLNERDVGWRPYVQTWLETIATALRLDTKSRLTLEQLFDTYVPVTLEWLRTSGCAHITPLMDFAMVETAWGLLEGLLCQGAAEGASRSCA